MKEKTKQIFEETSTYLWLIYAVLILVAALKIFNPLDFHVEWIGFLAAIIGIFIVKDKYRSEASGVLHISLFVISIIFLIFLRTIPYIDNSIPLGYDAGLYWYGIEHGLENQDTWILNGGMEPGFLFLMKPLSAIFSTQFLLTYGLIFFTLLLGGVVYLLTRVYFGDKPALLAFLIYSLSPAQFYVFSYLYYKNIIGLCFMLAAIYFLNQYESDKKIPSLVLFLLFAGFLGGIHRPTYYIFGLSYFFYAFVQPYSNKKYNWKNLQKNVLLGICILAISAIFYIGPFYRAITVILSPLAESFANPGEAPGTFLSLIQYQYACLAYIPLSLMGLWYLIRKKQPLFLLVWFSTNAFIVVFQLFFFNRFIIHLDIVLIILAGLGASILLTEKPKIGLTVIIILLISLLITSFSLSQAASPLISQETFEAISLLKETPTNSYSMAISKEYSPWVLALSDHKTIAPGIFDHDLWTEDEWRSFWTGLDETQTKGLMGRYDQPVYLFAGNKPFNNSCFALWDEKSNNKIFKYVC